MIGTMLIDRLCLDGTQVTIASMSAVNVVSNRAGKCSLDLGEAFEGV